MNSNRIRPVPIRLVAAKWNACKRLGFVSRMDAARTQQTTFGTMREP